MELRMHHLIWNKILLMIHRIEPKATYTAQENESDSRYTEEEVQKGLEMIPLNENTLDDGIALRIPFPRLLLSRKERLETEEKELFDREDIIVRFLSAQVEIYQQKIHRTLYQKRKHRQRNRNRHTS